MWMYDFHLFYQAGRMVLAGLSPYTIVDFNPPFTFALLAAPFALLPEWLAYLLFVMLVLWALFKMMGKRGFIALLSFPVFFTLFVGQVDLLLAEGTFLLGPWSAGLLVIKPQVAFIVAPWFVRHTHWKNILKAAGVGLALLALSFLIRPTWFGEWREHTPSIASYASRDSSLYNLITDKNLVAGLILPVSLITAVIALRFNERRTSWIFTSLFAPLSNVYSVAVLAEWFGWLEVILSWGIVIAQGGNVYQGAPMFIIMLSLLVKSWYFGRFPPVKSASVQGNVVP